MLSHITGLEFISGMASFTSAVVSFAANVRYRGPMIPRKYETDFCPPYSIVAFALYKSTSNESMYWRMSNYRRPFPRSATWRKLPQTESGGIKSDKAQPLETDWLTE